jgi:hypothetical protein
MFQVLLTTCLAGLLPPAPAPVPHKAGPGVQVLLKVHTFRVPLSRVGTVTGCLEELRKQGRQGKRGAAVFLDDAQVGQLLRAVQDIPEAATLTAPRLTVLNDQRASCEVMTTLDYTIDHKVVREKGEVYVHPQTMTVHPGWTFSCRPRVLESPAAVLVDFEASETTVAPGDTDIYRTVEVNVDRPGKDGQVAAEPFRCFAQLPCCTTRTLHGTFVIPGGKTAVLHLGPAWQPTRPAAPSWAGLPLLSLLWAEGEAAAEVQYEFLLLTPRVLQREEQTQFGAQPPRSSP